MEHIIVAVPFVNFAETATTCAMSVHLRPSAQSDVARYETTSGLTNAVFFGVEKLRVKRLIRIVNLVLAICHVVGSRGSLCFRVANGICPTIE